MDIDVALAFLADHHRCVLATRRADASPQMSPVVCAPGNGRGVIVSSRAKAMKTRNVLRDPRVSLCVLPDAFFGDWIQLDGLAEVVPLPDAMDVLVEYYRSISGEHDDWDAYRAAMVAEERVALAITVQRAGPDRRG